MRMKLVVKITLIFLNLCSGSVGVDVCQAVEESEQFKTRALFEYRADYLRGVWNYLNNPVTFTSAFWREFPLNVMFVR